MLTRTRFQEVCESLSQQSPPTEQNVSLAKGHVILINGKIHYIMARLQADHENPVMYSICDADLKNSQFGLTLEGITPIPHSALTEEQKRRAKNFA